MLIVLSLRAESGIKGRSECILACPYTYGLEIEAEGQSKGAGGWKRLCPQIHCHGYVDFQLRHQQFNSQDYINSYNCYLRAMLKRNWEFAAQVASLYHPRYYSHYESPCPYLTIPA
jgi:hypothetical protein